MFISEWVVLGYLWGGWKGFYPAEGLQGDTRAELEKQIKEKLDDGSLDAGMWFESLIGWVFEITEKKELTKDGVVYSADVLCDDLIIGLTDDESDEGREILLGY